MVIGWFVQTAGAEGTSASRSAELHDLLSDGSKLHDFQVRGVEWLIALYENGLNGILADGRLYTNFRPPLKLTGRCYSVWFQRWVSVRLIVCPSIS